MSRSPPANTDRPVEVELSDNGEDLYIFFGGIKSGIVMPPFEFYNASKIVDQSKIFVRDFSQCWYQAGLPLISRDVYSTARYLESRIRQINPRNVYFIGNSMGGFAAILFCTLINLGEAIAFAPQTFISPRLRLAHGDRRWKSQIFKTYAKSLFKRPIFDLKPLLAKTNRSRKISIFVSTASQLDHAHAKHVSDLPNVNVYEFRKGGHNVVKLIRAQGLLPAIMNGTYSHPTATEG